MNVAAAPASVVSKSQYALLKNVTPGRVSQWISEGKIEPDAIVGDGRAAKIDVAKADAHLRRKLDINQRAGNGISTRLTTPPQLLPQTPLPAGEVPAPATQPDLDPIEEQIKRERLESLQRDNRKKAEDEAARAGRYVNSQSSAAQMGKIAATMLEIFEGSLADLASALSGRFQIPQRDALHLLRGEFRGIRTRAAVSMKEAALALPSTLVEDEIETAAE